MNGPQSFISTAEKLLHFYSLVLICGKGDQRYS